MSSAHVRAWGWVLFLVASPTAGRAEGPPGGARALTEPEAVAAALKRAPLSEIVEGGVAAEAGRSRSAAAWANPELAYAREQLFGDSGSAENALSLAQSFDLSGRRGLRAQASDTRVQAIRRSGEAGRIEVATEARTRFYDLLHRQLRVGALDAWGRHVTETRGIVTRREERGDVATYDRRRLEREQVVADARLAAERAALARARASLQALLGEPTPVEAQGTLLPAEDSLSLGQRREASRERPDLQALELQAHASSLEQSAAGRGWIPDLRLEAGWKGISLPEGERADGYIVGLALTLPIWDRAQGAAQTAEGEARALRGQRDLARSQLDGELAGARAEAAELGQAAAELRRQVGTAAAELTHMATVGYEGGELGVIELLDAWRGTVDDELNALDLEHEARRSRIELDRLTGAQGTNP